MLFLMILSKLTLTFGVVNQFGKEEGLTHIKKLYFTYYKSFVICILFSVSYFFQMVLF